MFGFRCSVFSEESLPLSSCSCSSSYSYSAQRHSYSYLIRLCELCDLCVKNPLKGIDSTLDRLEACPTFAVSG